MNTRNLSLILGTMILVLVAGISTYVLTRPSSEAKTPGKTSQNPSTTTSYTISDAGTYYDIKVVYPYETPLGSEGNLMVTTKMKAWVDQTVNEFKRNGNFDALTPEDITMQGLDQVRKYALDIEYKSYVSPTTLSYVFQVYEDTLGAHPNAYYKTYTFDVQTGEEITLDDLFMSPNYLTLLSTISRSTLRTQIAKAGDIRPEEVDTQMLNAGTEPNSNSFAWFYLDGASLVLLFPPYSVGPWAIGVQNVVIPRNELKSQLKPEFSS